MTSRPIDYSKWDNIELSDDDSSSEEVEEHISPRVTKLETPGTVTRSSDGTISVQPSSQIINESPIPPAKNFASLPKIEFVKEGLSKRETLVRNGGEFRQDGILIAFWSQDRNEVILSVTFDPSVFSPRNIKVQIVGVLPFSERYSAVGWTSSDKQAGSLIVTAAVSNNNSSEAETLISGELPHFVHLSEGEDEVEWEIEDCENFGIMKSDYGKSKILRITLRKAVPMSGLSVWWSQPLMHFPTIDISKIQDRGTNAEKQEAVKRSWDEAHRLFKEKISSREKEAIDIDSGQDDS